MTRGSPLSGPKVNYPRLPFAPLRCIATMSVPPSPEATHKRDSPRSLAPVLGVDAMTVRRWVTEGVPLAAADQCATRLGHHPSAIWPEWWAIKASGADDPEPTPAGAVPSAPQCSCCSCKTCGQVDNFANGGCDPFCIPCSFDLCACPTPVAR